MSINLTEAFANFESWLDKINSKIHPILVEYRGYLPPDEKYGWMRPGQAELPNQFIPYPIQQVEKEIKEFVDIIVANGKLNKIVEIGLGGFGGTHRLWREIFAQVFTIEIDGNTIQKANSNQVFNSAKSYVIQANSHNPNVVTGLRNVLDKQQCDVLFIDGDHSYNGVKTDYLLYSSLVGKGGVIGFHDAATDLYGVRRFLDELCHGLIDGTKRQVYYIIHSQEVGIAYIKV